MVALKKMSKDAIGKFKVLIDHGLREYEPSPTHILKRILKPLCEELDFIIKDGTKNDAWHVLEGFSKACKKIPD